PGRSNADPRRGCSRPARRGIPRRRRRFHAGPGTRRAAGRCVDLSPRFALNLAFGVARSHRSVVFPFTACSVGSFQGCPAPKPRTLSGGTRGKGPTQVGPSGGRAGRGLRTRLVGGFGDTSAGPPGDVSPNPPRAGG